MTLLALDELTALALQGPSRWLFPPVAALWRETHNPCTANDVLSGLMLHPQDAVSAPHFFSAHSATVRLDAVLDMLTQGRDRGQ